MAVNFAGRSKRWDQLARMWRSVAEFSYWNETQLLERDSVTGTRLSDWNDPLSTWHDGASSSATAHLVS